MRVLVVEDDEDTLDLLRTVLAAEGADVICTSRPQEALRRLEADQPDVLVSDIAMPGMDGHTLLRLVRSLTSRPRPIPAVALSALAMPDTHRESIAAGFRVHLNKPVRPETIVQAVIDAAKDSSPPGQAPPHAKSPRGQS